MPQQWVPTLTYTAELKCQIFLLKSTNKRRLVFDISPNLGFANLTTGVNEITWKSIIEKYIIDLAAELMGLEPDDITIMGWGIGPCLIIEANKDPKKEVIME